MSAPPDLSRFHIAQAGPHLGFEVALAEIQRGAKRNHWIWYIFPQLAGLGTSSLSRRYGIDGRTEAEAYLRDPVLRSRLLTIAEAAAQHVVRDRDITLTTLMGSSIDAQKLVSSMTLFGRVARDLDTEGLENLDTLARTAEDLLVVAEAQGYPRCRFTLERLNASDARSRQ